MKGFTETLGKAIKNAETNSREREEIEKANAQSPAPRGTMRMSDWLASQACIDSLELKDQTQTWQLRDDLFTREDGN